MQVPEAFRAQYYLRAIENERTALEPILQELSFFANSSELLDNYASGVARSVDQILLPTIVYEIHKLKEEKKLTGLTARGRYKSFFVQNGAYTPYAQAIIQNYPFLFETIDRFIQESFQNLKKCLERFKMDRGEWLPTQQITAVDILESSDRHCSQQSLIVRFCDGNQVIYKPVDLVPDQLLKDFIEMLNLPDPYDLKCIEVLPKHKYGWIRFLHFKECETLLEVEHFFKRMGVLLAIADALNYSDGHCENLFACGAYPVLLDGETLFQNYAAEIADQKNITSTLLIQKLDSDLKIYSALQSQMLTKYEVFYTHAVHESTDTIQIHYAGISQDVHHHMPRYKGEYQRGCDFKECVIEGFRFGFEQINGAVERILNNSSWWTRVATARVRTVLRGTSAYFYLLRRIQHPDLICNKEKAAAFLKEHLGENSYSKYEINDLLAMNIPYFYHYPGDIHLFDGVNHKYSDAFSRSAVEHMRQQFCARTPEEREKNCAILHRYLVSTYQVAYSPSDRPHESLNSIVHQQSEERFHALA